jgi:hypothetical protein
VIGAESCGRRQVRGWCSWRQRCAGDCEVTLWLSRARQRAERQPHWRADTGAHDAEWGRPAARCARSRAVACGCRLHARVWLGGAGCALSWRLFTGMALRFSFDHHIAAIAAGRRQHPPNSWFAGGAVRQRRPVCTRNAQAAAAVRVMWHCDQS